MIGIKDLNNQFFNDDESFYCAFKQRGALIVCELKTQIVNASFALQGAHLLSWRPQQEKEVIWLSKDAKFAQGQSIRGGIPICWPWFGAHESQSQFPAHGFARTVDWQLLDLYATKEHNIKLHFQLDTRLLTSKIQAYWPHDTLLDYYLEIGDQLKAQLITTNLSDQKIQIGQALHTYFAVDDVGEVTVNGLDKCTYLDKPQEFLNCTQQGDIGFEGEVDRVYINTHSDVQLVDKNRRITISKQGSQSTIIWNPGAKVAERMGDLGKQGYLKMLCIESANAANDIVNIAAKESTELSVVYQLKNMS